MSFLHTRPARENTVRPQSCSTAFSRKKKYVKLPISQDDTKFGSVEAKVTREEGNEWEVACPKEKEDIERKIEGCQKKDKVQRKGEKIQEENYLRLWE